MSLPSTFRAAFLDAAAKPVEVRTRTLPSPQLADHEVAIKISAAAINPVDWKLQLYPHIFKLPLPIVLGTDAAGTIHAKGSAVPDSQFKVGERVFFQGSLGMDESASFQEYSRSPAAVVGKIPANVTDEEAAGVSLAGITAAIGLYHSVGRSLAAPWDSNGKEAGKGKALIVLGGASSVGQYAVQFARLSGYSQIITNSGAGNIDLLKKLGGANIQVLDRKEATKPEDFLQVVGEDVELDHVFDTIGTPETQTLAVQILQGGAKKVSAEGGMVTCTHNPEAAAQKVAEEGEKKVEIKGFLAVGPKQEMRYVSEPFYQHVSKWLETGEFVANKTIVVQGGVDGIEEALQKQKAGVSGAKVVVKF